MEEMIIRGGQRLCGTVRVPGAKNAALPIMAACILTQAPVTLLDVPDLLDTRRMEEILRSLGMDAKEKENWDGTRADPCAFQAMTDEEKDAYIKKNPAFGKVVCRCECVSEGEILAAIRNNPQAVDVDGVKRRTRSGMGRCQGGFCSPYIIKLIAKEHGIPVEEVTKFGGNSRILTGKL